MAEKELAKETRKDIGSKDTDIPGLMLNVIYAGSSTTSTWQTWFKGAQQYSFRDLRTCICL
jgi:hypothetical protein